MAVGSVLLLLATVEDIYQAQTTTASKIVYENRWMRVREDASRRRDGFTGIYGVVDKRDFVVIAPIDEDVVHLVQQYHYPVQGRW